MDSGSLDARLRTRLWRFVPGLVLLVLAGWFNILFDVIVVLLMGSFVYLSFLFLRGIWSGMKRGLDPPS